MSPAEQSAQALASIAADLKALVRILAQRSTPAAAPGEEVATDHDLDSQYGNPEIKKDPRDWSGSSYVGMHYSDAPAEYLDLLAGFLKWKAGKNDDEAAAETDGEKKKKIANWAKYARKDASRARGWAHRKRNGWSGASAAPATDATGSDFGGFGASSGGDGEIPFVTSATCDAETRAPRWERW